MGLFDTTLGAAFIGCVLTCCLYGVTCVQSFVFLQSPWESSGYSRMRRIGGMVVVLWVLDTVHCAFVIHSIYWYCITNFANPAAIPQIAWSIVAGILVTPSSDTIVRGFFTWRIWILSDRNRYLVYPLVLLIVIIWAIGIAFAAKGFTLHSFAQFAELSWLLYLGLGLLVLGDAYIALVLCFLLRKARSGVKYTDGIIDLLMVYTVQTGLLTSVASLGCLIAYAVVPQTYVFLAIYFPLSKLYINALLATLNARNTMRDRSGRTPTSAALSVSMGDIRYGGPTSSSVGVESARVHRTRGGTYTAGGGISVQVDTHTITDGVEFDMKIPMSPLGTVREYADEEQDGRRVSDVYGSGGYGFKHAHAV